MTWTCGVSFPAHPSHLHRWQARCSLCSRAPCTSSCCSGRRRSKPRSRRLASGPPPPRPSAPSSPASWPVACSGPRLLGLCRPRCQFAEPLLGQSAEPVSPPSVHLHCHLHLHLKSRSFEKECSHGNVHVGHAGGRHRRHGRGLGNRRLQPRRAGNPPLPHLGSAPHHLSLTTFFFPSPGGRVFCL